MQRSNIFDRFRTVATYKDNCPRDVDTYFIEHNESSTTINVFRSGEDISAVLVLTDQDGADDAYLFTYADSDFVVGDYFTWKDTTFFAYEQVKIVRNVDYIKFKVLECNALINDSIWGYFKSNMTSIKDTKLTNKTELSNLMALLVVPLSDDIKIGNTITIGSQCWDIEDGDIYTVSNVGYYYLSRGTNSRDEEEWEPEEQIPDNQYYVGQDITFSTETGYYKAFKKAENGDLVETKIKLRSRTMTSITIQTLEAGDFVIQTKQLQQVVNNQITVKENV